LAVLVESDRVSSPIGLPSPDVPCW
jgi:hypothetical protein